MLPPWINKEINIARKQRDSLHQKKAFTQYKVWRNKVSSLISQSKQLYYQNAIKENKKSGAL